MRVDIHHPSKVAYSYDQIKAKLFHHTIYPGQHIAINTLAQGLRCSVTPVREALAQLHFESLVEFKPNRGYYAHGLDLAEQLELHEAGDIILQHIMAARLPALAIEPEADVDAYAYRDLLERLIESGRNREMRSIFINLLDRSFGLVIRYLAMPGQRQELAADLRDMARAEDPRRAGRALANARKRFAANLPLLVREVAGGRPCEAGGFWAPAALVKPQHRRASAEAALP